MPIFKRFHQPARGQSDSRPNATPRSSEDGTLPIPKCCICGKEFPLRKRDGRCVILGSGMQSM